MTTRLWRFTQQFQPESNHIIATRYGDGTNHMPAHSDKTANLVDGSFIFDYSFGATRHLVFRDAVDSKHVVYTATLTDGSLLILGPNDNASKVHEVPVSSEPCGARTSHIVRAIKTFKTPSGMRALRRQHAKTQHEHVHGKPVKSSGDDDDDKKKKKVGKLKGSAVVLGDLKKKKTPY